MTNIDRNKRRFFRSSLIAKMLGYMMFKDSLKNFNSSSNCLEKFFDIVNKDTSEGVTPSIVADFFKKEISAISRELRILSNLKLVNVKDGSTSYLKKGIPEPDCRRKIYYLDMKKVKELILEYCFEIKTSKSKEYPKKRKAFEKFKTKFLNLFSVKFLIFEIFFKLGRSVVDKKEIKNIHGLCSEYIELIPHVHAIIPIEKDDPNRPLIRKLIKLMYDIPISSLGKWYFNKRIKSFKEKVRALPLKTF